MCCVQFLHKLTARALIRDYEDGSLATSEAEHEVCMQSLSLSSYVAAELHTLTPASVSSG